MITNHFSWSSWGRVAHWLKLSSLPYPLINVKQSPPCPVPSSNFIYCFWCYFLWGRRTYERTNHFMSSWWIRCFPSMIPCQFSNLQAGTGSSHPARTENSVLSGGLVATLKTNLLDKLPITLFLIWSDNAWISGNGCVNLWHRLYVRSGMLPWKCVPSLHPQGKS